MRFSRADLAAARPDRVANAIHAYHLYRIASPGRVGSARALGASAQRPLWASTGVKNPAYDDLLYVERLIAPGVINTMPEATLSTFRDHGSIVPRSTPARRSGEDPRVGRRLRPRPRHITAELEREGIESFCASYGELLRCIETKLAAISGHAAVSS